MWTEVAGLMGLLTAVAGNIIVFTKESPHVIAEEFLDMPASFGSEISVEGLRGLVVPTEPANGCTNITRPPTEENFTGRWIALIARYNCSFDVKVRNAQAAGYDCAIVYNVGSSEIETMSSKDPEGIVIPSVFVSDTTGFMLMDLYNYTSGYYVMVNNDAPFNINTHLLLPFAVVVVLCLVVILISMVVKCVRDRRRARRHRLPRRSLKQIPIIKFSKVVPYDTCAICLDDYQDGERLRVLPCAHAYHAKCVDPWLTQNRRVCPVCKRRVLAAGERRRRDSDSSGDDTAPLVDDDNDTTTQGGTFEEQRENPFVRAARLMRRLRRRPQQEEQETQAPAEDTAQIEDENADLPHDDTAPLLPPSAPSPVPPAPALAVTHVAERPRRTRRPRAFDGHSINSEHGEGEIGVAALPAPPLSSSTPHTRHINL